MFIKHYHVIGSISCLQCDCFLSICKFLLDLIAQKSVLFAVITAQF